MSTTTTVRTSDIIGDMSVAAFKDKHSVSTIDLKELPNEQKTRIWVAGEASGIISPKCDLGEPVQFVHLQDKKDKKKKSWVLCNNGSMARELASL